MPLPARVKGWSIPAHESAHESRPALSVVRGGWMGWLYQAGELDEAMTKIDPEHARLWIEESEGRPPGITVLSFESNGGWHDEFRGAAAALHFCFEDNNLGEGDSFVLHRFQADKVPQDSLIVLRNLGFSALYDSSDFTVRADSLHAYTSQRFPEFTQATPIPNVAPSTPAVPPK